jgi:hypothetical protein
MIIYYWLCNLLDQVLYNGCMLSKNIARDRNALIIVVMYSSIFSRLQNIRDVRKETFRADVSWLWTKYLGEARSLFCAVARSCFLAPGEINYNGRLFAETGSWISIYLTDSFKTSWAQNTNFSFKIYILLPHFSVAWTLPPGAAEPLALSYSHNFVNSFTKCIFKYELIFLSVLNDNCTRRWDMEFRNTGGAHVRSRT